MWIGRGFDTNSDGDNDVFIGRQLPPVSDKEFLQGCRTALLFWGIVIAGIALYLFSRRLEQDPKLISNAAAPVVESASSAAWWIWSWVKAIVFWGFIGAVFASAVGVLILGVLYGREKK